MDQRRQQRGFGGVVRQKAQRRGEHAAIEFERQRLAAGRIGDRQRQLLRSEFARAARRAPPRGSGRRPRNRAPSWQRATMRSSARSPSSGRVGSDRLLRIGHAVQHDGMGLARVTPHVELRDARAVGRAVEIDRGVAERDAHPIQIPDRDARGVEAHAIAIFVRDRRVARRSSGIDSSVSSPVLRIAADQGLGPARAALVDQHDVVIAIGAREGARVAGIEIRGRLPRPPREQKQGARRRLAD